VSSRKNVLSPVDVELACRRRRCITMHALLFIHYTVWCHIMVSPHCMPWSDMLKRGYIFVRLLPEEERTLLVTSFCSFAKDSRVRERDTRLAQTCFFPARSIGRSFDSRKCASLLSRNHIRIFGKRTRLPSTLIDAN